MNTKFEALEAKLNDAVRRIELLEMPSRGWTGPSRPPTQPEPPAPVAKSGSYVCVGWSKYRSNLRAQCTPLEMQDNAYGTLLWEDPSGERFPAVCGHGGSMWLCASCATGIIKGAVRNGTEIKHET